MTDEQAIAAITRTLHDATRDRADPAWTARAIITRLRGLGWRPTEARPAPGWQHRDTPPAEPTAEYFAARAEADRVAKRPPFDWEERP